MENKQNGRKTNNDLRLKKSIFLQLVKKNEWDEKKTKAISITLQLSVSYKRIKSCTNQAQSANLKNPQKVCLPSYYLNDELRFNQGVVGVVTRRSFIIISKGMEFLPQTLIFQFA